MAIKKVARVQGIQRTEPMRIHKNVVIRLALTHPEDMPLIAPDWTGTPEEFVAELERRDGEYFVGGVLED